MNLGARAGAFCAARREQLLNEQKPFAIVLGCSDSRVPAEIVFDQGLGDLFVIRIAGNIVQPSQIGSVEFAAHMFGARLAMVMGHTQCGAVQAALDAANDNAPALSPNISAIVDHIRPAIQRLTDTNLNEAVKANVRFSVDQLRNGSSILRSLQENDGLSIVGAVYSLETGYVEIIDR